MTVDLLALRDTAPFRAWPKCLFRTKRRVNKDLLCAAPMREDLGGVDMTILRSRVNVLCTWRHGVRPCKAKDGSPSLQGQCWELGRLKPRSHEPWGVVPLRACVLGSFYLGGGTSWSMRSSNFELESVVCLSGRGCCLFFLILINCSGSIKKKCLLIFFCTCHSMLQYTSPVFSFFKNIFLEWVFLDRDRQNLPCILKL